MKMNEINIRDPYILPYDGKYYLYGTRSATCWGPADGFDAYVSVDLEEWDGPYEIFHRPEGFWADQNYWAPECYYYKGEFCLLATLGGEGRGKSINLLKSASPLGPFRYVSTITDPNKPAIDGTFYFENGIPYMVYSNPFENGGEGEMFAVRLSENLERMVEEPIVLFSAPDAPWAKPAPWAKEEHGIDRDIYLTDGPTVYRMKDGTLSIIWSSWSNNGYAVGVAISQSGTIAGPWVQQEETLFPENGGHGMLFTRFDGANEYLLHYPNDKFKERPIRRIMEEHDGTLCLK